MRLSFVVIGFLLLHFSLQAQDLQRMNGPLVQDFGAFWPVADTDFSTDTEKVYKVIFDVHNTADDPAELNVMLNTLARFLNMHAWAGVPKENLHVACVIHNKASKDALSSEFYRKRYGVDNPNEPLLEALEAAGADIYMCGQSIYSRGMAPEQLAEPVQIALSAMTIILSLEEEGYQLIRF